MGDQLVLEQPTIIRWSSRLFALYQFIADLLLCSLTRFPGQSGTGRTTFVNTLCETDALGHKELPSPEMAHLEDGIKIKPVTVGR